MSIDVSASCDTYVSMLKARRMEEEHGRRVRANRRADFVTSSLDFYRRRETAMRRRVMEEKLRMTSHVEHDLFYQLDEQAKWRHVMYENVRTRDEQHAQAREEQRKLMETHLQNLLDHERERVQETVNDDTRRWKQVLSIHDEARRRERLEVCGSIVGDIVELCGKVIDFADHHDLEADARAAGKSLVDVVPAQLVREWGLRQTFHNDEARVADALVRRHESQSLYGAPVPVVAHNVMFSSLTQRILAQQFPTPPPFFPKTIMDKPVLVLLGPKYSGKSVVARAVSEQLGLVWVSDVALVEEALAEAARDLRPEDLTDDAATRLMELGRQARAVLLEGRVLPTSLIVALVLHRIRTLPPTAGGLLLDGVPGTVEGFAALEKELSGYDEHRCVKLPEKLLAPLVDGVNPADPMFVIERADLAGANGGSGGPAGAGLGGAGADSAAAGGAGAKKDGAGGGGAAAKPKKDNKKKDEQEEPLPPIELPVVEPLPPLTPEEQAILDAAKPTKDTAGIHAIVHIDCTTESVFERFAGLRVDTQTGEEYHLALRPPPLDRVPFLVPKDRTEADTAKLHRALQRYGDTWLDTRRWAERFEGLLRCVDGTRADVDVLVNEVTAVATDAMERAQAAHEAHTAAATLQQQRRELEQLHAQRLEAREAVRRQLAAVYTERGVEVLPPELQPPPAAAGAAPSSGAALSATQLQLPAKFPAVFLRVLDSFTEYYSVSVAAIHRELGTMLQRLYDQGTHNAAQFRTFWAQPDALQRITDGFVAEFNTMQPALRRDVQGKEELHLRIDGLAEALHAVVDRRRDEGQTLIEGLCNPGGYLDPWTDGVRILGASLAQLEAERFYIVKHLSTMYFAALRNEQYSVDEAEMSFEVLPPPRGVHSEPTTPDGGRPGGAGGGGGKDGAAGKDSGAGAGKKAPAPPPKKGANAKVVEEPQIERPEEIVQGFVDKLVAAMKTACERMTPAVAAQQQPGGKDGKSGGAGGGKKGAEVVPEVAPPQAALFAAPIAQAEFELAKQRLAIIADFTNRVTTAATERNAHIRAKLLQDLRRKFVAQISATNSVVFHLRCAVEEERPTTHRIHIAGDHFAIDRGQPLVPPALVAAGAAGLGGSGGGGAVAAARSLAVLDEVEPDPRVLSCLTLSRAQELIRRFALIAPDFAVHRADFLRIVAQADYTPDDCESATADDVFTRFDALRCDVIDWREFMVHLLLWCEPQVKARQPATSPGAFGASLRNEYFVDGPSLLQLFDQRNDFGSEPLGKEEFEETMLFFENGMSDERLACYRELLWSIFATPNPMATNGAAGAPAKVDPNVLVMFLCADPQPLRGVQKAFAMAAPVGDETCALNVDMLHAVYHFSAVNAKSMGMVDPYDWDAMEALAAGNEVVTFQDLCNTHIGRVTLNNTEMYRRKRFSQ